MPIVIRSMQADDARAYLDVQRAAVRGLAADYYPQTIIEAWAPIPITNEDIENVLANPENEFRLIAEVAGEIAGMGSVILDKSELRACYVTPKMARKGVGSALVREMERVAREQNLTHLEMISSINAEPFYTTIGYEIVDRTEHLLVLSGQRMACVIMRKTFKVPL